MSATEKKNLLEIRANRCMRAALAVGGTAACGSVLGRARDLLVAPEGGWPETIQARRNLYEAVDTASSASNCDDVFSADEIERAAELIVESLG